MILSASYQAKIFLLSVTLGVVIAALYDCVKIFRLVINHKMLFIQLEDALYWFASLLFVFFVMLEKNYGEIRFFLILGVFLGMLTYFLTLSRVIMSASEKLIRIIKNIVMLLAEIILTPIRLILKIILFPLKKADPKIKKGLHLIKLYAKIKIKAFKTDIKLLKGKSHNEKQTPKKE